MDCRWIAYVPFRYIISYLDRIPSLIDEKSEVNSSTKLSYMHNMVAARYINHPIRNVNPAPDSPVSPPAAPPNTPVKSNLGASCPRFGASGVCRRRRFSIPALDGNVGNISLGLGRGSSRKYWWERHCAVVGRDVGFRASRDERRWRPAFVSKGNLERGRSGGFPVAWAVEVDGRRRDLALGRERKPGQVWGVGGPVRANILTRLERYLVGTFG